MDLPCTRETEARQAGRTEAKGNRGRRGQLQPQVCPGLCSPAQTLPGSLSITHRVRKGFQTAPEGEGGQTNVWVVRGHWGQEDTRNTKVQGRPEVRGHRRSRDTGVRGHRKSGDTVGKIDTGGQGTPGSGCMENQGIPVNGGPERPPRGGGGCAVLHLLCDTHTDP